ncbi:MAG TPA: penicillin-binding protein 1C, partial [Bacteroidales bacterium]|nr:penicillin-binding protein 1C [Bacteroidales bacterium]
MYFPGKKWVRQFHIHPWKIFLSITLLACFLYLIGSPRQVFDDPTSTVIIGRDGTLIGALIADDGQWRFPCDAAVPEKFRKCILTFEDKNFYKHYGYDPAAILRALYLNIRNGSIVSGASTITMQVIRLSRKGRSRSIKEKITEIILASRLELSRTKNEILALYASNAPFGGNVVGLDAASWRYFGRKPSDLSWAESATLAVLPNAPALIHPGRNRSLLLEKRNRLLNRLFQTGQIDTVTYQLALLEPLPEKPLPLPDEAPHLLARMNKDHNGQISETTIDPKLQYFVNKIINHHYQQLKFNHIYNIAVLVADNETGNVLAYNSNVLSEDCQGHGEDVDLITAPRSSGSVLKPLLYATMLDKGELLPDMLIPDVPTHFNGFSPENYDHTYSGAVPASHALARSLNVPAVRMLKQYGVERFHYLLRKLGFSTITYPAEHYGLSLILGGAEISLWDLTGVYSGLSRNLSHFSELNGNYNSADLHALRLLKNDKKENILYHSSQQENILSAASLFITFNVMVDVNRPAAESSWRSYNSSRKIAWKTGTSYGNRDAWALGLTKKYTVGVWVGNASGEGRPLLTGLNAAAPVLFDVFEHLPASEWFLQPYDDMTKTGVCHESGYRASQHCPVVDSVWVPLP